MPKQIDGNPSFVLTILCPDVMGIVAEVSAFLARSNAFITESSHYGDPDTGQFFMRTVFRSGTERTLSADSLKADFSQVADQFSMVWELHDAGRRTKAVIAVSKFGHCLNDLLHRVQVGAMPIDVVAVVSNHETFRDLVEWHKVPFYHLPVTPETKRDQEQKLLQIIDDTEADLLVLARYMQILSDSVCGTLPGRVINIHHSFLPGFKGARPYHQAHARGVKIIGATAHYVTPDLDEGPIIEQAVERVDHTLSPDDLVHFGRDIESTVLSRAVRWHAEHRVLLNGTKTVVFR